MTDIVDRLVQAPICTIEHEAADEIKKMRQRVKELESAIKFLAEEENSGHSQRFWNAYNALMEEIK
jgi:hypothetical protein